MPHECDVRESTAGTTLAEIDNVRSAALGELLFMQRQWQLRKVESHKFQEGNYSVVRVSIDCVPQNVAGLRYQISEGQDYKAASFITPITYMKKGVLRQLDMRGPGGEPLPVIGRVEYTDLMLGVLRYEMESALVEGVDAQMLHLALMAVLDDDAESATQTSTNLVEFGSFDGHMLLEPGLLSNFAGELLKSLSKAYVLFVLVPARYTGTRVVIKYSHQIPSQMPRRNLRNRLYGAAGLEPVAISYQLSHPTGAASHHLEILIPDNVVCSSLTMPEGAADENTSDASEDGVVHAVSSYSSDPRKEARAEFRVPWRGMRARTWLVSVTTFAILYLGLVLPGAQSALLNASGGAAALLLGVPAAVVAFAVGPRESSIEAALLGPLRIGILTCAVMLLACAASLVGVLDEPFRVALWSIGAAWSGLLACVLCLREVRERLKIWGKLLVGALVLAAVALWGIAMLTW